MDAALIDEARGDRAQAPSDEWRFDEGAEIYPGRYALKLLGGGRRYEACLAFDEELLNNVVVKILRPSRVKDEHALEGLECELRAAEAQPSRNRARVRGCAQGRASTHLRRVPRGAAVVDADPQVRAATARTADPAGGRAVLGAALYARAADGAPRRQAQEHHHGGSPAPDPPQHRPQPARRGRTRYGGRDRRLHGSRAVRPEPGARRPSRRHLGTRGHAL